jgi:hypothetical protein
VANPDRKAASNGFKEEVAIRIILRHAEEALNATRKLYEAAIIRDVWGTLPAQSIINTRIILNGISHQSSQHLGEVER